MSDAVVQATVAGFRSLADGTLRIQVDVHHGDAQEALGLLCEVGAAVAVARLRESPPEWHEETPPGDTGESEEPEKRDALTGQVLAAFYKNGFWHAPRALKALGNDAQFLQWCRGQPHCWHCGGAAGDTGLHGIELAIQAAHVRRVGNGAGTGTKPPFSAIPLCNVCHGIQHAVGESGLGPPEWWDSKAAKAREEWGHERLREHFGTEHVSQTVSADDLWTWLRTHDLLRYVSKKVRDSVEQRQREAASGSAGGVGADPVVEG